MDDQGKNEEAYNFGNSSEDDELKYYGDDLDSVMNYTSTHSEKYQINNDISIYFDNGSKEENGKKHFGGPVKKNRSAYNLFIKDRFSKKYYSKIKKVSTKEAMVKVIKEWRELSDIERKYYEEIANKEKEAYQKFKKSRDGREQKLLNKLLPKRPIAPYSLFQIDERKEHPDLYNKMSLESAARAIAQKWKTLDKNIKSKYTRAFNSHNKVYEKAKRNLKVQQLQGIKVKCEKRKVHQPFVAFIKENYNAIKHSNKSLKHKAIMTKLSEKWRSLTQDEKDVYKQMIADTKT
jgi:hypothetical protein